MTPERFTLHIPQDVRIEIAFLAHQEGRTISRQIVHILRAALADRFAALSTPGAPDGKLR